LTNEIITLEFQLFKKLSDFCNTVVGRRPDRMSVGRGGKLMRMEFDPDLTGPEKTALNNALPDYVKRFYDIRVDPGTLDTGSP